MPIRDLKAQIARLPEQPGVYVFENGAGETLYVGKARVLRDRVRSYLSAYGTSPRHDALLDDAQRLQFIVTDSVMEALALENHLIKQRAPRYNILLRDDKNYPYLQLTTGEAFPRVLVARRVERDDHFYAGPFLPAKLGRRTMDLTHRLFGIRSCNEVITGERVRPCLEFDIKRCIAPCVRELCGPEQYREAVEHTRLFLEGRNDELIETLRDRMQEAAEAERFEQAAQLRDALRTIETVGTRQQKMASAEFGDRDVVGLKVGTAGASVQIFQVRHGRVVERVQLISESERGGPPSLVASADQLRRGLEEARGDNAGAEAEGPASRDLRLRPEQGDGVKPADGRPPSESERGWGPASRDNEVLQAAVQQFYEDRVPPPEVHVPLALPETDASTLEDWLSSRADRRVRLVVPKRGEKRGLLDLVARNAEVAYQQRFNENTAAHYDALETLRAVLSLPAVPRRIECFDISTIQGSETVASMVVCEDGRMRKGEYRKFRIRGPGLGIRSPAVDQPLDFPDHSAEPRAPSPEPPAANNDFAAMNEVVVRRYRRLLEAGGPFPDLILIDGGKGQLTAAYAALEELGLGRLIAVGIAKKEELLYTRDREAPIALAVDSPALLLIQRIRDEAHRFAVTFHRARRARRDLRSDLDTIPNVGPRRRKALLTTFGSLAGVRRATREELARVVGTKTADAVLAHFANQQ